MQLTWRWMSWGDDHMVLFQGTRFGQIWIIICKRNKNIDLFSETEIVTFQHNLPGLRYACAKGPEACRCHSGRNLLVASVGTPEHPVSLPHYCETFFCPDAPLGGWKDDSLREQGSDYMEDVVECSISVSGWCPWCEQPCVDGRYPGEMTLMFASFFSCSWWLSLLGLREVLSNTQHLLCNALWGNPHTVHL